MVRRLLTTHGWSWRTEEEETPVYHIKIIMEEGEKLGEVSAFLASETGSDDDICPRKEDDIEVSKESARLPIRKRKREESRTKTRRKRVKCEEAGKKRSMDSETLKQDSEFRDLLSSCSSESESEHSDKV
jgi:hypothetical protein